MLNYQRVNHNGGIMGIINCDVIVGFEGCFYQQKPKDIMAISRGNMREIQPTNSYHMR
jgi:hypothetical protein